MLTFGATSPRDDIRTIQACALYQPAELPEVLRLQKELEDTASQICALVSVLDLDRARDLVKKLDADMEKILEIPRKEHLHGYHLQTLQPTVEV